MKYVGRKYVTFYEVAYVKPNAERLCDGLAHESSRRFARAEDADQFARLVHTERRVDGAVAIVPATVRTLRAHVTAPFLDKLEKIGWC